MESSGKYSSHFIEDQYLENFENHKAPKEKMTLCTHFGTYPKDKMELKQIDHVLELIKSPNYDLDFYKNIFQNYPKLLINCNKEGMTPLMTAACCRKYDLVKYILNLKEARDLINMGDCYGNTPLIHAIDSVYFITDAKIMKLILDKYEEFKKYPYKELLIGLSIHDKGSIFSQIPKIIGIIQSKLFNCSFFDLNINTCTFLRKTSLDHFEEKRLIITNKYLKENLKIDGEDIRKKFKRLLDLDLFIKEFFRINPIVIKKALETTETTKVPSTQPVPPIIPQPEQTKGLDTFISETCIIS